MPMRLMCPRCGDGTPDLDLICGLAVEFRTTVSATAVRFLEECREICVVVFSGGRKVKWWRAREDAPVWIERGQPVDRRSDALAPSGRGKMRRVATEAWFPDWHGKREVYEQSMVLGRLDIDSLVGIGGWLPDQKLVKFIGELKREGRL